MSPVPGPAAARRPTAGRNAWERGAGWHAAFVLTLVVTLGVTAVEAISPARKAGAAAVLVALAVWYATVGRAATRRGDGRLGALYLSGAFAAVVPLFLLTPVAWIMLFALCPQSFAALPGRRVTTAAVAVLGLVAVAAQPYWSGHDRGVLAWAAVAVVAGVGFSIVQQDWIGRVVAQSRERAELIDRLERTRAELAEAQRQAGALLERERLAGEIHDTLAQGFSSILMLLHAAEFEIRAQPDEAERHVDLARRTAGENLAEARALIAALAPAPLDAAPLHEALGRLVERLGAELGISADFERHGEPVRPLCREAEVVLLRATQEALANARKHAAPATLRVRLSYDETAARLVVEDDGSGFDPARTDGGFGLRGMRGRVEQVGGTVDIASTPGAGTTVTVRVPV